MGMLNNLRKRIVNKLIRPEDGYIYACTWENEPVQFYYDNSNGKSYYSRFRNGRREYFEATLSGWKHCDNHGGLVCINFDAWMIGILDDVYNQYNEKLSNISRRELKSFNKKEEGEKFVINKKSFCDIMESLDKYWGDLRNLEGILNVYFEDNMLTTIFDKVIDALEEDLYPNRDFGEDSIILNWLFEFDAGRDDKAKTGLDGHSLTTAEELYDYLVWKRDGRSYVEEV